MLRLIIGGLLIIFGILFGLYVGVWLMFVGGIIQIVQSITPNVIPIGIVIGIIKVFFASIVGYFIGVLPFLFGITVLEGDYDA